MKEKRCVSNLSERTLRSYERDVLPRWMKHVGTILTQQNLIQFVIGMREDGLKATTCNLTMKYSETAPRLSVWIETNVYQGLTVMSFPFEHQKRLRTTNLNEQVNRELKRRTRVGGVFPNVASLERLATAVLIEIDEDWQSGTCYLAFPSEAVPVNCEFTEQRLHYLGGEIFIFLVPLIEV